MTGGHFRQDVWTGLFVSLTHSSHLLHYINSLLPLSVDLLFKVFVYPWPNARFQLGGNLWKMDLKPIHKLLDAVNDRINKLITVYKEGIWRSGLNCLNRQCLP